MSQSPGRTLIGHALHQPLPGGVRCKDHTDFGEALAPGLSLLCAAITEVVYEGNNFISLSWRLGSLFAMQEHGRGCYMTRVREHVEGPSKVRICAL
jgi:hypothetical protein